ncbi:MAG: protein tyrosine phosphatase family protein [Terriglobia bacterium]
MKSSVALAALLLCVSLAVQAGEKEALAGIKNFLWVNREICTGGQPTLEELEKLKAAGVRAVVNLRRPSEHAAAAEAAKAKALGLRYFNIPVDSNAPTDAQVEEFLRVLADRQNRPVFIHCASANRVGAFWLIRRVVVDSWTVEKAEQEAERIGLANPRTRAFARDYLRRHKKD